MRRITAFTIAIILACSVSVCAATTTAGAPTAGSVIPWRTTTQTTTTATTDTTTSGTTATSTTSATTATTTTDTTTVGTTNATTVGAATAGSIIPWGTTTGTTDTTASVETTTTDSTTTTATTSETTTTTTTTITTTVPTTTTTTAKPTDAYVENVQYAVSELPTGAIFHGENMQWVNGRKDGKALQFNGTSDCIEIDMTEQEAPFTLSMWVNWQANIHNSNAVGQRLFSLCRKNTENEISFIPWYSARTENGETMNGMALLTACYKEKWIRQNACYPTDAAISNMLTPSTWHHIAMTVEENTISVFIDGMLWSTLDLEFAYADLKPDVLYIGGANDKLYLFEGAMEDIRLYENALTQQQVLRLFRDADAFDATLTDTPHAYAPAPLPQNVVLSQSQCIISTVSDSGIVNSVEVSPGAAFWETPALSGGQSVTCTLYLENRSKHVSGITLSNIALPEPSSPAYQYLSEILITVSDMNGVLYSGRYTDLTVEKLAIRQDSLAYGGGRIYTITLSREFTSTADFVAVNVPWTFDTTILPTAQNAVSENRPQVWLIVLLLISTVAVIFSFYCAVVQKQRRVFTVWDSLATACRGKLKRSKHNTEDAQSDDQQDM